MTAKVISRTGRLFLAYSRSSRGISTTPLPVLVFEKEEGFEWSYCSLHYCSVMVVYLDR